MRQAVSDGFGGYATERRRQRRRERLGVGFVVMILAGSQWAGCITLKSNISSLLVRNLVRCRKALILYIYLVYWWLVEPENRSGSNDILMPHSPCLYK